MRTRKKEPHPRDEVLSAFTDGDAPAGSAAAHLAACPRCRERVTAFQESRRLLRAISDDERAPQSDLAGRALGRLRARNSTINVVNEVFQAVVVLLRGLGDLFSDPRGGGPKRG